MSDRIKFIFETEFLLEGAHGPFTIITKDNSKIVVYNLKLEDKYMSINSNNDGFEDSILYEDIISICDDSKDACVYKKS